MTTTTLTGKDAMVRLSQLRVDHAYQRQERPALIRKIAGAWDDDKAGAIYISHRPRVNGAPGYGLILDGQQRVAARHIVAAQRREAPEDVWLHARIYQGLTPQEEAALFVAFNGDRSGVTLIERFKARCAVGEPQALHIKQIMDEHAPSIQPGMKGDGTPAIGSIESIYVRYGPQVLSTVMGDAIRAFGRAPGAIMTALAAFYEAYPQAKREHLIENLKRVGYGRILQMVGAISGSATHSSNTAVPIGWGITLVTLHNKGLHSNRVPEWTARRVNAANK